MVNYGTLDTEKVTKQWLEANKLISKKLTLNGSRYICHTSQMLNMNYDSNRVYNMVRHYKRQHCELKTHRKCCGRSFKTRGEFHQHDYAIHDRENRWFHKGIFGGIKKRVIQRKSNRKKKVPPNGTKRGAKQQKKGANKRASRVPGEQRECNQQEFSRKRLRRNNSLSDESAASASTKTEDSRELELGLREEQEFQAMESSGEEEPRLFASNQELKRSASDLIGNVSSDGEISQPSTSSTGEVWNESEIQSECGVDLPQDLNNDNQLTGLNNNNNNIDIIIIHSHTLGKNRKFSRSSAEKENNNLEQPIIEDILVTFDKEISSEKMTHDHHRFLRNLFIGDDLSREFREMAQRKATH